MSKAELRGPAVFERALDAYNRGDLDALLDAPALTPNVPDTPV